jgi:hypothetical protein
MRLVVVGTVPISGLPYYAGTPEFDGREFVSDGRHVPCTMGTAGAYAAALLTERTLRVAEPPLLITAGDIGRADGSRLLYKAVTEGLEELGADVLVLHYIMPILTLAKAFSEAFAKLSRKPFLVADAGSMYAFKACGQAGIFDLMTPDPGEMAFLADPDAVHPAYMERHLFQSDTVDVVGLIGRAYQAGNMPRHLIVKGVTDYVVEGGSILYRCTEPLIPSLEPIGGTGDTITGIVSGLICAGFAPVKAMMYATKINRMAGLLSNPTPKTLVHQIASKIPEAIGRVLEEGVP